MSLFYICRCEMAVWHVEAAKQDGCRSCDLENKMADACDLKNKTADEKKWLLMICDWQKRRWLVSCDF